MKLLDPTLGSTLVRAHRFIGAIAVLLLPIAQTTSTAAAPELPRQFVDTRLVAASGRVINVASGGNFQSALDSAQPGDTIKLQAGATFRGPFTLPQKLGSGWIIVRTSAPDGSLPAPGKRITPGYAHVLPKIVSADTGAAIQTAPGAHHFRFIGVEIALGSNVTYSYGLVRLGDSPNPQTSASQVPHHLIFDRVYVHGRPNVNLRRGFSLNSAWTAVIDSYISDAHEVGADSQAIAGWNGPGPFKIANNYLEGAGENVIFGGSDPSIANLVPSDIEIRGNHFYKPLSWRIQDPSYAGFPWTVKNLFELKNARRVLVEGNVFENNWLHGQNGFAILFTPRNQDGKAPWSVVEDVTFVKNILRHSASGHNISGTDSNHPSQQTKRILIKDNLYVDVSGSRWGGSGRLFQMLSGTADVTIDHNTAFHSGDVIAAGGPAHTGLVYRNNLTPNNQFGVGGDSTFGNPILTLSTYFPGAVLTKNLFMGGKASVYPPGNFFPASWNDVRFVDLGRGDYRLAATSPYRGVGTDGKDVGADMNALNAATAGATTGSGSSGSGGGGGGGTSGGGTSVTWTERVNVTAAGSVLQKTGGCDGCQDAGAISFQRIASGNAAVEVTASGTGSQRALGLSRGNTDTRLADIDWALQFWPDGGVDVREQGGYRAETTYVMGDVFRIAVETGRIKYYKNGKLFYTSAQAPTFPLRVDTAFLTRGATLRNIVLK